MRKVGEARPTPSGIPPVNWLSPRKQRLARLPNSVGIPPVNWFPPKSAVQVGEELRRYPPVNWLNERYSRRRLARFPNSAGISPVNWFP